MGDHFDIAETPLSGLMLISRKPRRDERGYLERLYDADVLGGLFGQRMVMQINRTLTHECGTVRGMHFQLPPHAECKLVSCLHGSVFDVAVEGKKPIFSHSPYLKAKFTGFELDNCFCYEHNLAEHNFT